jgi:cob(I)alamin adenosyltransferase
LTVSKEEVTSSKEKSVKGLVQVFTGNGKGKTTAALGTILRAVGHGLRVFIVFFMKGDYTYGEFATLRKLPNIKLLQSGFRQFTDPLNIKPEEKEQAESALAAAREATLSGKYDLVVLDEVNVAVEYKLIDLDEIIDLVRRKPENVELILTGRYADNRLIEIADLATEMINVKHPFEKGINARKGIEY